MKQLTKSRYVYFVRPIGGDGRIKIGCSYIPAHRLVQLGQWSPYELELIGAVAGDFAIERALHQYFAADRIHHEWFRSSAALLSVIDAMKAGATLSGAIASIEMRRAA